MEKDIILLVALYKIITVTVKEYTVYDVYNSIEGPAVISTVKNVRLGRNRYSKTC